jgi:hypothetical protein
MEKVFLIGGAILLVGYFIFTETLDWVGRIEVIRDHFPKFPEFLEKRIFRVALLLVAIGLLIRVATESNNRKAEPTANTSKLGTVQSGTTPTDDNQQAQDQPKEQPKPKTHESKTAPAVAATMNPVEPIQSKPTQLLTPPTYSVTNPQSSIINQNSTNYGQQQIISGTVSRRIPENLKPVLMTLLSRYPHGKIRISVVSGESFDFAQDWHDLLNAAGWDAGTSIGTYFPADRFKGALIWVPGDPPKPEEIGTQVPLNELASSRSRCSVAVYSC